MEYFLQQVINGVTLGSIYGLIAIGYTMVFGIIGMVNFAHGDVFMLSTFIALIVFLVVSQVLGWGSLVLTIILMMLVSMLLTSLWNWAIEKFAYRPLRGSFRLAPLISAIGMSIFLMNFVQVVQGPRNKPLPPLIDGCLVGVSTPVKPVLDRTGERAEHFRQADRDHAGDLRAADGILVPRSAHVARPRAAGMRTG